ncbi:MAG: hypothetical protein ACON4M_07835 [Crocinitomicaceae bacterium]
MKTKVCKILNIVVISYILNLPAVITYAEITPEESVVITVDSPVETQEFIVSESVQEQLEISEDEPENTPSERENDPIQDAFTPNEDTQLDQSDSTDLVIEPKASDLNTDLELLEHQNFDIIVEEIVPVDKNLQHQEDDLYETQDLQESESQIDENEDSTTQIITEIFEESVIENPQIIDDLEYQASEVDNINNELLDLDIDSKTSFSTIEPESTQELENEVPAESLNLEKEINVDSISNENISNIGIDANLDSEPFELNELKLNDQNLDQNFDIIQFKTSDQPYNSQLDVSTSQDVNTIPDVNTDKDVNTSQELDSVQENNEIQFHDTNTIQNNSSSNTSSNINQPVEVLKSLPLVDELNSSLLIDNLNEAIDAIDNQSEPAQVNSVQAITEQTKTIQTNVEQTKTIQTNVDQTKIIQTNVAQTNSNENIISEEKINEVNLDTDIELKEKQIVKIENDLPENQESKKLEVEDLKENTEKDQDQKLYTEPKLLDIQKKIDLDMHEKLQDKMTIQRSELNQSQSVFIEFKTKTKIQNTSPALPLLLEKESLDSSLQKFEIDSFEIKKDPRQYSSNNSVEILELDVRKLNNDVELKIESSSVLSSLSSVEDLSILAMQSHKVDLDSPSKNQQVSTNQVDLNPKIERENLDFLDHVHPSKVSQDSNLNGCVDLIEDNLEFSKLCNFLNQNTKTEKQNLELNLPSSKNVFNTQKVVLNGLAKPNSKVELHLVSLGTDNILSILQSDKNGNFIYVLESNQVPSSAQLYLKDLDSNISNKYDYSFDFTEKKESPTVLNLCGENYIDGKVILCNPKKGFDIKIKSEYQTVTKAYFNSVIHTGLTTTNNTQDVAILNPDSKIIDHLKSGQIHRVILQNFDPENPNVLSEPVEVFYKVHYPIINPVLLPLFVLLSLLAVVILYDYFIYSYQNLNSKLIYESYQVFKNSDINPSNN